MTRSQSIGETAGDTAAATKSAAESAHFDPAVLQTALDSMLDPHVLLRALRDDAGKIVDFVYVWANRAACEAAGLPRERLIGTRLLESVPAGAGLSVLERDARAIELGRSFGLDEFQYPVEIDPARRYYDVRAVPIGDVLAYTFRDVTTRVRNRQALEESQTRYRLLADHATDVVYAAGPDRRITWVSPTVSRTLGWTVDDLLGTEMAELLHPDDRATTEPDRTRMYGGEFVENPPGGYLVRMRSKSGVYHWMTNNLTMMKDNKGNLLGIVGGLTLVDDLVSARQRAEADEALMRAIADAALDPQVVLAPIRNVDGVIINFAHEHVNTAACEYLAKSEQELLQATVLDIMPGLVEAGLFGLYVDALDSAEPLWLDEAKLSNALLSSVRYYDIRATRVVGSERLSVAWRDVTERVMTRRELERRAHFDDLTGMLKRQGALERLAALSHTKRDPGAACGVLFIDVDGFKGVNDSSGHAAGDLWLRALAERINEVVRSSDTVARMGGDEFLVILDGIHGIDDAAAVAEKIREAAAIPVLTADSSVSATVSIGVTLNTDDEGVDAIIRRADQAMYRAKSSGRNRVIVL